MSWFFLAVSAAVTGAIARTRVDARAGAITRDRGVARAATRAATLGSALRAQKPVDDVAGRIGHAGPVCASDG